MRFLAGLCLALLFVGSAVAAPKFPVLTGRVVDGAGILSPGGQRQLERILNAYEHDTTTQVVVVTVSSLQGLTIEDYGVQLGRHWQIGQKDKNNGILLIVAPNEHELRIEVGYGLEGVMTDALANQIITSIILPEFRQGRPEDGVLRGTEAILDVLGGKKLAIPIAPDELASGDKPFFPELPPLNGWHIFGLVLGIGVFIALCIRFPKFRWFWLAVLVAISKGRSRSSSGSSSSGSRGSSSGGGGSFGGGGSSGKW